MEIHGAHGYLLEEFLKTQTNQRTDNYGANLNMRLNLNPMDSKPWAPACVSAAHCCILLRGSSETAGWGCFVAAHSAPNSLAGGSIENCSIRSRMMALYAQF